MNAESYSACSRDSTQHWMSACVFRTHDLYFPPLLMQIELFLDGKFTLLGSFSGFERNLDLLSVLKMEIFCAKPADFPTECSNILSESARETILIAAPNFLQRSRPMFSYSNRGRYGVVKVQQRRNSNS